MDHGAHQEDLSPMFSELDLSDGKISVFCVLRNKAAPYDPPISYAVQSIDDIKSMVDNIPNQVHLIGVAWEQQQAVMKVSLSSKSGTYNLHCGKTNAYSKVFDVEIFEKIKAEIEPDFFFLLREWVIND